MNLGLDQNLVKNMSELFAKYRKWLLGIMINVNKFLFILSFVGLYQNVNKLTQGMFRSANQS